ncbi:unnamed protein product [Closterium sp. NIES-65]|nr:unnamed protein product [Closterium sp. NIES-65]
MAECLRATSALIVRDPRCAQADNDRFLDMMESYFAQPKTTKLAHSRPELHYQVGVTPEGVEMPQSALDEAVKARMAQLPADSRPHAPSGPDCKWRFMWRVGPRPARTRYQVSAGESGGGLARTRYQVSAGESGGGLARTRYQVSAGESGGGPVRTRYQELNASPVVPEGFPQWASVMDGWGCKMTAAVEVRGMDEENYSIFRRLRSGFFSVSGGGGWVGMQGDCCSGGEGNGRQGRESLSLRRLTNGSPQWAAVMDGWGCNMTAAVEAVAEMLAIGFDLPQDSFTSRMHMPTFPLPFPYPSVLLAPVPPLPSQGPHLLAPTGSDLGEHGSPGTVLAGYHADANSSPSTVQLTHDLYVLHPFSTPPQGPHLLAPTGSDLGEHGSPGTVLAGYHADLNFLTIHGRCRFPGLRIWLRDGTCCRVSVPDGCLLLQAGKQMEWLTGGEVAAGMHEVVVDEGTVAAVQRAQQQGRSLWRVSSTVFAHIASDEILTPIWHFAASKLASSFPPKPAGEFVEEELAAIQLKTSSGGG